MVAKFSTALLQAVVEGACSSSWPPRKSFLFRVTKQVVQAVRLARFLERELPERATTKIYSLPQRAFV